MYIVYLKVNLYFPGILSDDREGKIIECNFDFKYVSNWTSFMRNPVSFFEKILIGRVTIKKILMAKSQKLPRVRMVVGTSSKILMTKQSKTTYLELEW